MSFDRKRARELGRLGGHAKAAKARARKAAPAPFAGTMLDAMSTAGLVGPSWAAWRAFWATVDALPLDGPSLELFRQCTGRTMPPTTPAREAAVIVGRRGGKTRNAAVRALYRATRTDYAKILAEGERAVIPVIAADRKQAGQALSYVKGLCKLPTFDAYVGRVLKESVEFRTGVTLEVHTASYRTVRGYTIVDALADEIAFWATEDTANPDSEILTALRPGMATIPGALLLMLSTPYARRGELYRAWERFYGQDGDVLVWVAPSLTMHPTLSQAVVDRAYEDDPIAAAAEYGAEFRRDVEAFLAPETVSAAVRRGPVELTPVDGVRYVGFVDPSGGSQDSFTVAIAHREGTRAIVDVLRERRPPFSPDAVIAEYAALLRSYRIHRVTGDRYGGLFPRELFQKHGIDYRTADKTKSEYYHELLAPMNAGRVELPDVKRLTGQLVGLERRVSRSGKDSIDHAPGGHDDLANAVAGVVVTALREAVGLDVDFGMMNTDMTQRPAYAPYNPDIPRFGGGVPREKQSIFGPQPFRRFPG